ncbi:MAG: ABC transporter permease [Bacillota bacterium]
MRTYVIRRTLQAIPLLLGITVISFLIMKLTPGDPVSLMSMSPHITPADLARMRHNFGFDQPVYIQYFKWLSALIRGDWGISLERGRPVIDIIAGRLPNTLQLMAVSFVISVALAIPIGILSATKRYSWFDYGATTLSFFGVSMPVFWFGLILIVIFSVKLHLLPSAGMMSVGADSADIIDRLRHIILPAVVLSLSGIAGWSRYMRSSMLEVVRQDYIRTARAKGLAEKVVIYKHALKNAMIPVITVMALEIPGFFTGAVITETIFAWPGMGRLYYDSVMSRDYTVLMAILTIGAGLVVIFNLIADIAYAFFDPRIKYD